MDFIANNNKIFFIFNAEKDKNNLLKEYLNKNGFRYISLDHNFNLKFQKKWNRILKIADEAYIINYPIVDSFDLNTIIFFMESIHDKGGSWFYSPLPNEFTKVNDFSLIGMKPPLKLSYKNNFNRLYFLKNSILLKFLPNILRNYLKAYLAKYKLKKQYHNEYKTENEINKKNDYFVIPTSLNKYAIPWNVWCPPENIIEHDIIERISYFFPYPKSIHVTLLNKCNLRCIMCPYHSPLYTPHHKSNYFNNLKKMEDKTFNKIIDYASKHKISLQLGQIEEALLHENVFDFIHMAKKKGVPFIHITTNGTLLDDERILKLANSGVDSVMFSVDAATEDTYKKIRGSELSIVENNIKNFLPLAKKNNIKVYVSFIMQDMAKREKELFYDKWRNIGVDSITFYVLTEHDKKTGEMIRNIELYDKGKGIHVLHHGFKQLFFPKEKYLYAVKL